MDNTFKDYRLPDKRGHFKQFGGKYVPEILIPALEELEHHYDKSKKDSVFQTELYNLLKHYAGRETALYHAARISEELDFDVWLDPSEGYILKVSYERLGKWEYILKKVE